MIREDPAVRSSCVRGRGTETSAEVLVGPPWRMESNAGQQQWYGGDPCTPDRNQDQGDQGKPGEPGHRNIGRGSYREGDVADMHE